MAPVASSPSIVTVAVASAVPTSMVPALPSVPASMVSVLVLVSVKTSVAPEATVTVPLLLMRSTSVRVSVATLPMPTSIKPLLVTVRPVRLAPGPLVPFSTSSVPGLLIVT